jgi:hypothetical protein
LLAVVVLVGLSAYSQTPLIVSTTPASGPIGTVVQINGSGFGATQGSSTVAFNGVNGTASSWSDGQITATVPLAETGPVTVTVGSAVSNNNVYFMVPPPQVTGISPSSGTTGTQVTVTGTGFGPSKGSSSYVYINNGGPLTVTSWNSTQIVGTIPSGITTGPVTVLVDAVFSNPDVIFTTADPIIRGITPSSGPVNTQVQISGSGFGATQGTSAIKIGAIAPNVVSWSDSQITATLPAATVTGAVQVTVAGILSNTNIFFTVPPPQITSISPTGGVAGAQVTVNGSGFQAAQGSNFIQFNGLSASVSSWSDTRIVASVPGSATTGPVTVNVNSVPSNSDVVFKLPGPLVSGLVPASGPTGTQVQVNGSGFGATQGTSTITFNGYAPTVGSWSDTAVVATVPSTASTGPVVVTVAGIPSPRDVNFTVPGPQVTSISPIGGPGGTQVTINGSGYQATQGGGSSVYFNGRLATINSWSNAQIVATVPAGVGTGPVSITVNNTWSNQDVVFTMADPIVTGVSRSSGPVGTQVTISGKGFGATQGTSALAFSTATATSINSWSDTQIVATVPTTATSGSVKVTVGSVASNTDVYFTVPRPQITGISPSSGAVGTQVTVNGLGFQAARGSGSITFNYGLQGTVTSWSDTTVVATVPSGATSGSVSIRANNGDLSNQDQQFTMPNPVVSSVSPVDGPVGTQVTVAGSGFGASQGASTISFNTVNAAGITSWSDSQIVATVPSGATTGTVKVTNGGVGSNTTVSFTVGQVTVGSVNPSGGAVGTQVTVTGAGFGTSQGGSTISFNGTNASSITSWIDSQIVATVPGGATTGAVKVVVSGVSSNTTVNFTVTSVVVNNVSPASGPAGSQFQINGSGFGSSQGSSTLRLGFYAPAVVSWTNTQITATAPAAAGSGAVVVTVGSTASNSNVNFTVVAPVVASVSPTSGAAGTQVQINGSGFGATQGSNSAAFNGQTVPQSGIVSWSDSQIVANVPQAATTGTVTVTAGGLGSNQTVYFTVPKPQITGISPASGVVGTQVTITGSGFHATQGSNLVSFYPVPNTSAYAAIVSWSDTAVVATVPPNAISGAVTVNVNGASSNQDVLFTMPNPQIMSVSPSSGTIGATVQVNGSGFGATQGTSALTFYPNQSATVTNWSDTQITATVPTGAAAGYIKVTEGGVASNSNINFNVPAPHVTGVSPANGPIGTQVTVTGSGFLASRGSNSLFFGPASGYATTFSSWSDTQIVATVPSTAITGPVQVNVDGVNSNPDVLFTLPNPKITGLSPSSGPVGTQVTISGSGFGATQGSSTLVFYPNVTATPASWSDTQIVVTVPTTATTGAVTVTEGGVNSNNNIYFTVPPPHVGSLSPASGVVGTQVTVNGSGFQATQGGNSKVTFNGGSGATVASWSDTQVVATVPAGTVTGPVRVYVNNISSNPDVEFTLPNPQIAGISPSNGPAGTQVQINGSGFGAAQGTSTLAFTASSANNGPAVATIVSWSDTQIVTTVPTLAITGPIGVTEGGVASNANIDFTVPSPQITGITPNIGGIGNPVTITGSGFRASPGAQGLVSFPGNTTATITSWSDTQIQAIVPGWTSTGPVRVIASNGEASNYVNYTIPNLTVTTLSPPSGPVGTSVTVTGTGFGAAQGTSTISFEGQPAASVTSWSNTQIVATVPVTAITGTVLVTVNNINSNNTIIFTVPAPNVGISTPTGGVVGTQVTIQGQYFQASQRNSTVTFNGVAATPTSWSDTQIVTTVPSSATTGPLQVTVNGVSGQMIVPFEVPHPAISGVNLSELPTGGHFTINGSGFGPNYGYNFSGSQITTGWVELNGATTPAARSPGATRRSWPSAEARAEGRRAATSPW